MRNEIRLMEATTALAEELNFSRAAHRLRISQPALTKQIAELEGRLGLSLFERNHQTVNLTDAGRAYVEEARLALLHSDRAVQAARAAWTKAEIILRVGRSPYTDPFLTSTLLSVRLPLYPNLKVDISSDFACDLVHEVLASKLDLAFATEPPASPMLSMTKVAESPFYIAFAHSSGLARHRSLTIQMLDGKDWVIFGRRLHPGLYDAVMKLAEGSGTRPRDIHHILVPEEAYQFLTEGNSVAFLTKAGALRIARNGVTLRPLVEDGLVLRTFLASRADNESKITSEMVRAFVRKISLIEGQPQLRLPIAG